MKKRLLTCGMLSSIWYIGMNIFIPLFYEGYSYSAHTISELSAIGAPTRTVWLSLGVVYTILFTAFGVGVLKTSVKDRHLRVVAIAILAYSVLNIYWPPMHQRGVVPSITDTLHIVWTSLTVILMMVMMGFSAVRFRLEFRYYTIATIFFLFVFGFLTSVDAPKIPDNLPTPWLGIWERVLIILFMLWVIVLSSKLTRAARADDGVAHIATSIS